MIQSSTQPGVTTCVSGTPGGYPHPPPPELQHAIPLSDMERSVHSVRILDLQWTTFWFSYYVIVLHCTVKSSQVIYHTAILWLDTLGNVPHVEYMWDTYVIHMWCYHVLHM